MPNYMYIYFLLQRTYYYTVTVLLALAFEGT